MQDLTTAQKQNAHFFMPLVYLGMFYITAIIMADVATYRLFVIDGLVASSSLFFFPLTYSISDITTEVYGKRIALKLIFCAVIAEFFSDMGLSFITHVSSLPDMVMTNAAFSTVLGSLPRVFLSNVTALVLGAVLNVTIMYRLKEAYKGRYFVIRSIISTFSGEIVYVIVVYLITFVGKVPMREILVMMCVSMSFKIIFALIVAFPCAWIAHRIAKRASFLL